MRKLRIAVLVLLGAICSFIGISQATVARPLIRWDFGTACRHWLWLLPFVRSEHAYLRDVATNAIVATGKGG